YRLRRPSRRDQSTTGWAPNVTSLTTTSVPSASAAARSAATRAAAGECGTRSPCHDRTLHTGSANSRHLAFHIHSIRFFGWSSTRTAATSTVGYSDSDTGGHSVWGRDPSGRAI